MNNYLNLLGLAARARAIVCGEPLIKSIQANKVHFVLIASDASENSRKKITDKCQFYQVDYHIIGSSADLSKAIGKANRVAVGIINHGFAQRIKKEIGG